MGTGLNEATVELQSLIHSKWYAEKRKVLVKDLSRRFVARATLSQHRKDLVCLYPAHNENRKDHKLKNYNEIPEKYKKATTVSIIEP